MIKVKETVRCKSFGDGVLKKSWTESRMVYSTRNGLQINDRSGKKSVVRASDGVVDVEYHWKSINDIVNGVGLHDLMMRITSG